ncbi:MAG TPA: cell division protein FtsZ [Candidatus Nanoarchaeia archaeon]|nr:cell division protein FtsZ [Candidatus Nanoarchaeia archaeon]
MPQIKPEVETFARIKVLGVGGSGRNAINHMISSKVRGVEFIAINTDAQDLHNSTAKKKIHIGKNLTRGLGTGMNPELGRRAVDEAQEEVREAIAGADMVFIACGAGGGTGSGAAPRIAQISKELGALTVAVITKPFFFEGLQRMRIAEQAIEELRGVVDAMIVIPNDRLLSIISKETTAKSAFAMCDEVLRQAVEAISDLITTPGLINIDFADVKAIMENAGPALMGIGSASGEKRAEEAAKIAINSPLLELSIAGAKGVLFSIAGGDDLTMFEIQDAAKIITESVDPSAKIIFGTIRNDGMKKGEVRITVIATGFPETSVRKSIFQQEVPVKSTPSAAERKAEEAEKKGKIYNTLPPSQSTTSTPVKVETPSSSEKKPIPPQADDMDDDEWSAVPAFLRRSKLK